MTLRYVPGRNPNLTVYSVRVGTGDLTEDPDNNYWFEESVPTGSTNEEVFAIVRQRWPDLRDRELNCVPF